MEVIWILMNNQIYNISWIIHDFLNTFLAFIIYFYILSRDSGKKSWIISVLISLSVVGIDILLGSYANIISILIITLCLILIKSEYKRLSKLIVCIFSIFLTIFTQGMASIVIVKTLPTLSTPRTSITSFILFFTLTLLNYFFALLILSILNVLRKKYLSLNILEDPVIEKIILVTLIISFISLIALDNMSDILNIQKSYLIITLLITCVVVILLGIGTAMIIYSHIKDLKTNLKLEQMNERDAYINELEKNNDELRKFKHDYKNLLLSLSASINNENDLKPSIKKLLSYEHVDLESDNNKANLYKIKDKLVKGILVTKLMSAKHDKINVDFEIDNNIKISSKYSVDITRILGILLDNAMDACLENNNPELDFALISFDGYMEYIVKNNVKSIDSIEINDVYKTGYTTKQNHSGLGLATVKDIVNSNEDFLLQTQIKDGYYSTILTVLDDK